jgi:hypothetical protein
MPALVIRPYAELITQIETLTGLSETQIRAAMAIVHVFEVATASGGFHRIGKIHGDNGGISYGVFQFSINSGNLGSILTAYVSSPEARYAAQTAPFAARASNRDARLNDDLHFEQALKQIGFDPVMQRIQIAYGLQEFGLLAANRFRDLGLKTALGYGVMLDSAVHGAYTKVVQGVRSRKPALGGDEKTWVADYLSTRRGWLTRQGPPLLCTVYRIDTFRRLIEKNNWSLTPPFLARSVMIKQESLV